jgi:hypothetical protein
MTPQSFRAHRSVLVLAVVVGALVIVSLVVVFSRGEPPLLDESTPEGVVQRYSSAVLDGDEDAALGYLSDDAQVDCGVIAVTETEDVRVSLISTDIEGESAEIAVSIARQSDGGPFGGSGYEYEESFSLTRTGDEWRIETAPWELAFCRNDGVTG